MSKEVITEQDVATMREQRLREGREEGLKQWYHINHPFQDGFAAAVFLNTPPAQGPGEAMTTVRDDGTVEVFVYF
jgi:hypothetical protein